MPLTDSVTAWRTLFATVSACLDKTLRCPSQARLYLAQGRILGAVSIGSAQDPVYAFYDEAEATAYPRSVLESVFRLCNPILFTHDQFNQLNDADAFVATHGITSFICLPIETRTAWKAALWLERTDEDFSFKELDALEALLTSQQHLLENALQGLTPQALRRLALLTTEGKGSGQPVSEGEDAVEAHLRLFERAVKTSEMGFLLVDARLPDQPVIYCNPAFERISGYGFREVVGRNCRFLQRDDRDQPALQVLREAIREGRSCQVLLRNYHKNGRLFWNELTVSAVRDAQNEVTHFIGMQADVTARLEAERLKQEVEARFHSLFAHSLDGIAYYGPDGRCISANRAFCGILGYPEGEILGIHFNQITPEKWRSQRELIKQQLFSRGVTDLLEKEYLRKDGTLVPVSVRVAMHHDASGKPVGAWTIVRDISEYKRALLQLQENEARMEYLAYHDVLTRLPNRLLFQDRVSKALERARRHRRKLAVLLLDLDRFKNINDSLGHTVGDQFLMEISTRLSRVIRDCDTAARIGGDEFVVVLEDFEDVSNVSNVAAKLLKVLSEPIRVEQRELYTTASIGISIYPGDGDTVEALIKAADAAMYRAKEKGKNNFHFYTEDINRRTFELLLLENDLRRALDHNQFFVAYQPQFALSDGALVGVEALMRWQHPVQGLVAPAEFIPLAEETGLIVPLGRWMLRASCCQFKQWLDQGYALGRIAVNLSVRQFRQPGLVEDITDILNEVGLSPEYLELEITESIAMDNVEATVEKLEVLKGMGLQLSIDDFGTGYSSLSYLKRFAIDKLKIDKSFVRDIATDPNDAAIAASTIALAHKMGLKVIAEGVETAEQVAFLREQGCDEVQGFFYGKPMTAADLERLLEMKGRLVGADRPRVPASSRILR